MLLLLENGNGEDNQQNKFIEFNAVARVERTLDGFAMGHEHQDGRCSSDRLSTDYRTEFILFLFLRYCREELAEMSTISLIVFSNKQS